MQSMPAGRPSDYTPQLASRICERLSGGESLRAICGEEAMPDKATVLRWLPKHEEFRDQYARARELQAEHWAEEILEIADDGAKDSYQDSDGNERVDHEVVARSRLRVDSRKWLMSKLAPKKYGDRQGVELTGKDGGPIETADTAPRDLARAVLGILREAKTEA
jgi:hypothetical protein